MSGALELLPRDQAAFQQMLGKIRGAFERFGFAPIETPVMEHVDVLLTKEGGETEKQVYLAQSTGSKSKGEDPDLALRFDLTVPLARYVAQHEHELNFPFRRYQIQQVYRGERPQGGRFREFYQCDIDVIGRDSLSTRYDAEIPAVIHEVFTQLNIGSFTIHINNRKILLGFLIDHGIEDSKAQAGVLREVDKLSKRGLEAVEKTLSEEVSGLGPEGARQLMELVSLSDTSEDVLNRLEALGTRGEVFEAGVTELRELGKNLAAFGVPQDGWCFDLAIARGLDYYTGTVYETVLDDHPEFGSICSGGRYENLAGHYTTSSLPGIGISIGASRLFIRLQELGLIPAGGGDLDVLVTRMDSELDQEYLALGASLREGGLSTEIILEDMKLKKQMKYADQRGVRMVVIMGTEEQDRGTVTVRDMVSGDQEEVPVADLVSTIKARCEEKS